MFFDGENITQEDLVAWVNVGMHHLPQAEDSPNTRTNVATSRCGLYPRFWGDVDDVFLVSSSLHKTSSTSMYRRKAQMQF